MRRMQSVITELSTIASIRRRAVDDLSLLQLL